MKQEGKIDISENARFDEDQAATPDDTESCFICMHNKGQVPLNKYFEILDICFGVIVNDHEKKICHRCGDLLKYTSELRNLIRCAFDPDCIIRRVDTVNFVTVKQDEGDFKKPLLQLNYKPVTKKKKQHGVSKITKIHTKCVFCKQKHLFAVRDKKSATFANPYVCARCKAHRPPERVVRCDQCRELVPAPSMRAHLELHARANLSARCRLRCFHTDFTERISKGREIELTKTGTNSQLKLTRKRKPQVPRCYNNYFCKVCKKDMRCAEVYQMHVKAHSKGMTALIQCKQCFRIFKTENGLHKHSKIHKLE